LQNADELEEALKKCDYDWEIIEAAREYFDRYICARDLKDLMIKEAQDIFDTFCGSDSQHEDEKSRRKEYAMLAIKQKPVVKSMMFCLYDGRLERLHSLGLKLIYNEGKV